MMLEPDPTYCHIKGKERKGDLRKSLDAVIGLLIETHEHQLLLNQLEQQNILVPRS